MMKTSLPRFLAPLLFALPACGVFDDDEPPAAGGTGGADALECVDEFADLLANGNNPCPAPYAPELTISIEGDTVFWVDDPSNATTIGPGGWLFGNLATADWLGYILEGDQQCGLACVVPQGHPCYTEGNSLCTAGDQSPGCQFCGPEVSLSDCESFVANACVGPGGGGADSTNGGAEDTGLLDSSGGYGAVPDVSFMSSQPSVLFGTTEEVLRRLGDEAPTNLVAEDICDTWRPSRVVTDSSKGPTLERDALRRLMSEGDPLLAYCDHLRLAMGDDGVKITDAGRGTLAYELGFRNGDALRSVNGTSTTDVVAVMAELTKISEGQQSRVDVRYTDSNGRSRSKTIRIR